MTEPTIDELRQKIYDVLNVHTPAGCAGRHCWGVEALEKLISDQVVKQIIRTEKLKLLAEVRERVVGEHKPKTRGLTQSPNNAVYWTKASQAEFGLIEQQLNNLDKLEAEL